ncbi:MAG: hypothetical protein ABIN97_09230 [Ginsengibacter sp.]
MNSITPGGDPVIEEEQKRHAWQQKLLPWMIIMPTILIGIFIFLATLQMRNFDSYIYHGDKSEIESALPGILSVKVDSNIDSKLGYIKLYTLAKMEELSLNRRYNQAGALMMSGIYTKYLGFFTGMIMAIVGSVFIISKLKEDATNLDASISSSMKFTIISSSPGIIFGLLGTILMTVTILKKAEVNIKDMPLYLNYYNMPKEGNNMHGIYELGDENDKVENIKQHIDSLRANNTHP